MFVVLSNTFRRVHGARSCPGTLPGHQENFGGISAGWKSPTKNGTNIFPVRTDGLDTTYLLRLTR